MKKKIEESSKTGKMLKIETNFFREKKKTQKRNRYELSGRGSIAVAKNAKWQSDGGYIARRPAHKGERENERERERERE